MKNICEQLKNSIKNQEVPVVYISKYREFGIKVLDGGSSNVVISYCPFCGKKLPASLRDRWFDELEKKGIDDPAISEIPTDFNSDKWWKKLNI